MIETDVATADPELKGRKKRLEGMKDILNWGWSRVKKDEET